jgi:hypothetical protein
MTFPYTNQVNPPFSQVTLTEVTPPDTSLSIDTTVWLGKLGLRRVAAKAANLYFGNNTSAQDLTIPVGNNSLAVAFTEATSILVLVVSQPVTVQLTMGTLVSTVMVNQLLTIDSGVIALSFSNANATDVYAQLVSMTNDGVSIAGQGQNMTLPMQTDKQLLFNDAGAIGQTPNLTYDKLGGLLTIRSYTEFILDLGDLGTPQAVTLDVSAASNFRVGLGFTPANFYFNNAPTISPSPNIRQATGISVFVVQDSVGNRQPIWPSSVKWHNGIAPIASPYPGDVDVYTFVTYDGGVTWLGTQALQQLR